MKLKETFSYPAGVEAVFALISDDAFRTKAAEDSKGRNVSTTVEKDGADTVVTLVRTQPADLPDFIKKFVGDAVKVKQVERWHAPGADGTRTATVSMKVSGQPAGFKGTATLAADGTGAAFVVAGDVKVDVPFLGKKIEPVIAKAVEASLRYDVKAGVKRLS
ncbi:MAG TPA: DUF2505 domain-containing protein [Aeromicrobium sp.]|nr:DUF2505 domain-containing protein [Aeromicrobium sp.]HKY57044.1 DUF2505 domain-containing protein [Aeromicrobium sp.]